MRRVTGPTLVLLLGYCISSIFAAEIWTDANGDGLPDSACVSTVPTGNNISVDVWLDAGTFAFTNFVVFIQHQPCYSFASGQYVITGGSAFPIDSFTHPEAVGFGGWAFPPTTGVQHICQVTYLVAGPGRCAVFPIVDPDDAFGAVSAIGNDSTAVAFDLGTGSCWRASAPEDTTSWGRVRSTLE
jgi:hypothetical protein